MTDSTDFVLGVVSSIMVAALLVLTWATIAAIKESLAQTQEPVAWRTFDGEGGYEYRSYEDNESYADEWNKRNPNHSGWVDALYTHPQRTEQEPWCMKMNDCKTKCEDCPDEPPQRTERPVDCERCNRLEEHAYDLVGKLRVANIKLSMQPQRTWVDLTDEEIDNINYTSAHMLAREVLAKFKEKNT